ncbi:protein KRI1-like [Tropilaelaps mercedesae]|uniref:Protein KRI1 homolog n=1 Tax=Tropilaelaps mercedesae TaxID=418985 RepID=A0A1V9XXK7_9ACAR|nr:protein KRI1-like [Tropilaelaps mercedesae]
MADLFAGCSSGEDDAGDLLRFDSSYARRYDEWRRKEELMKAKARFGSDLEALSSSNASDAEEEDEDASQWTSEHEKKFFATLSALKGHDPNIYNKDAVIFGEVPGSTAEENADVETAHKSGRRNKKKKPARINEIRMTLKDYERKIISEEGGIYADEGDVPETRTRLIEETEQDKLAYDEEQKALRDSLKAVAWEKDDDLNNEGLDFAGGLVIPKERKIEQEVKEEEQYVKWLKGETDRLSNKKEAKDLANLKRIWAESGGKKLDEAEKFLRDYVLNKRYLTAKEDDFKFDVDFSEDEKDIEEMNAFEHKYPRMIEDSMRRKDTRRVDKRAEKKARKEQERTQLREEVNRLKSIKKKEILGKIDKLKSIAGSADIAFNDADVDGDFNPEEHDRRMAQLFASYDEQEGEDVYPELGENDKDIEDLRWQDWDEFEALKSQFESDSICDSEEDKKHVSRFQEESASGSDSSGKADKSYNNTNSSNHKQSTKNGKKSGHCGVEKTDEGKQIRGKNSVKLTLDDTFEKKAKKRKKSKFAQALLKNKPTYDPERDENFEKYFDEYYSLDFEDIVGGLQTRFKYRQVVPNDFGLSTEEVLSAQDKELNKWCSLKKMVQYRSDEEENKDLQIFSKRKNHMHLKKKIFTSVYAMDVEKPDAEIIEDAEKVTASTKEKLKSKSRKNKKKKQAGQQIEAWYSNVVEEQNDLDVGDKDSIATEDVQMFSKKRKERTPVDKFVIEIGEKKKKKQRANSECGHEEYHQDDEIETGSVSQNVGRFERNNKWNLKKRKHKKKISGDISPSKKPKTQGAQQGDYDMFSKKSQHTDSKPRDERHALISKRIQKKDGRQRMFDKGMDPKTKTVKTHSDKASIAPSRFEPPKTDLIPWEELTSKQKKNRRNALLKKRKKAEVRKQKAEKVEKYKDKFRPLEELQMTQTRIKAYGLNLNKVKGSLLYASSLPGKVKSGAKKDKCYLGYKEDTNQGDSKKVV